MSTPWDVYAQEMSACCQGYPMWDPVPEEYGEVRIGDVGYISEGRFFRLFNAICKPDDEINKRFGVPHGHEQFVIDPKLFEDPNPRDVNLETILKSGHISFMEVSGEAKGKGMGATLHFSCTKDSGAILARSQGVVSKHKLQNIAKIPPWLKRSRRSWWKWAVEECHIGCREDEIIFVHGWIKTTDWAVCAFVDWDRAVKLRLDMGYDAVAKGSISFSTLGGSLKVWSHYSNSSTSHANSDVSADPEDTPPTSSRHHGKRRRSAQEGTSKPEHQGNKNPKLDQCIFLHYTRVKERPKIWQIKMKAAAKYYELPRKPDDDNDDPGMVVEAGMSDEGIDQDMYFDTPPRYDPVDIVLDYILEQSNASCAVASTDDVINLYKIPRTQYAGNIHEILRILTPRIDVGEDGMGKLDLGTSVSAHGFDTPMDAACAVVDDALLHTLVPHDLDNPRVPTDTDSEFGDSRLQVAEQIAAPGSDAQNRRSDHARAMHPRPIGHAPSYAAFASNIMYSGSPKIARHGEMLPSGSMLQVAKHGHHLHDQNQAINNSRQWYYYGNSEGLPLPGDPASWTQGGYTHNTHVAYDYLNQAADTGYPINPQVQAYEDMYANGGMLAAQRGHYQYQCPAQQENPAPHVQHMNTGGDMTSLPHVPYLAPSNGAPCRWDGGACGIELHDLSPAGVIRHLKEYHFDYVSNPWNNRSRGKCRWDPKCRSDDMNYENFGKHVAAVHLKGTHLQCPRCGCVIGRADSLARHLNDHCRS